MNPYFINLIFFLNLLASDEIYYSKIFFGKEEENIIKNIEIIGMENNRLFYLDGSKKKHISCDVLNHLVFAHKGTNSIFQPDCMSIANMYISRGVMLGRLGKTELTKIRHIYHLKKKSLIRGLMSSIILPTSGHAYAENWGRGLLFLAAEISVLIKASKHAQKIRDECIDDSQDLVEYVGVCTFAPIHENNWLMWGFPIIYIWDKIDAIVQVKKYNKRLYREINQQYSPLSLNLQPTYKGANLNLSYSFK